MKRLGDERRERHEVHAEAEVEGLDPLLEETKEMRRLARRSAQSRLDHRRGAVGASYPKGKTPATLLGAGELPAQHPRQTLDARQDAVMRDDRLRQRQPRREIGQREKRDPRLLAGPERLIEAKQNGLGRLLGVEPPFEARARQIVELADALQAEPPQEMGDLGRKTQSLDREKRKRRDDLSIGNDSGRPMRETGKRMRAAQGLGKGKPRGETCAAKPPLQIGKKCAFTAEEMGHAAHVEPEPVGAIEIERGAVAARRPSGEIAKRRFVLLGRCGQGEKTRTDGAGIGKAKTGGKPLAGARLVEPR